MTKITLAVNGAPLEFTLDDGLALEVREGAISVRHIPQSFNLSFQVSGASASELLSGGCLSFDNPLGEPEPLAAVDPPANAPHR